MALTVRIHDLRQGRAALDQAAARGIAIELATAVDAANYVGCGVIRAMQERLAVPLVADCGDVAGTVMSGLRVGLKRLLFRGRPDITTRLAQMATNAGAVLLAELPEPVLALRPGEPADRALERWLERTCSGTQGSMEPHPPCPGAHAGSPGGARRVEHGQTRAATLRSEPAAMNVTPKVKEMLSWYESENPGVKTNIARLLMTGKLAGTGKLVILPVDQGFEHGPARSFASNPAAYDPHYLFQLAIDAGLNAYAAPLGPIEQGADTFAGQIPLILKVNSANSLTSGAIGDQAVTASVSDALRLGCAAIGFTMYPGSDSFYGMQEELAEMSKEAKSKGLATVVWSYPRGGKISKEGETALDIVAYAAHMAALMGANIIKVKPPKAMIDLDAAKASYEKAKVPMETMAERISHVMQTCFNSKRIVVFSGGEAKGTEAVLEEIKGIAKGGANGSIVGRNAFQRPKEEALSLLREIVDIYAKAAA